MSTSKPTTKERLKIKTNVAAGVGYACVNPATGHTVFSGTTGDGGLLGALEGTCKSAKYNWLTW